MVQPTKRLPSLPAERALKVIGGRWKPILLYHLFEGPKRFSELQRLMPELSQKVMVEQLREMEEHGVVARSVAEGASQRVDYQATPLGLTLKPVLLALCDWGRRHAEELDEIDQLADCARVSLAEAREPPPG